MSNRQPKFNLPKTDEGIIRWAADHRAELRKDEKADRAKKERYEKAARAKKVKSKEAKARATHLAKRNVDEFLLKQRIKKLEDEKATNVVNKLGEMEKKLTSKTIADKNAMYTLAYQATQLDAQNDPSLTQAAINKYNETYELMKNHPYYETNTQFQEQAEEYKSRSNDLRLSILPQSASTSQARGAVGGKKYRKRKVKKSRRKSSRRKSSRRKSSRRKSSRRKSSRKK